MIFIVVPPSARRGRVRQERHLAGVLDRAGDLPLLLGGHTGDPTGTDLAPVRDELPQQRGVLVIDVGDPVLVERVHLLLRLAQCRSLCHCSCSWFAISGARPSGRQNGGSSSKFPPPE